MCKSVITFAIKVTWYQVLYFVSQCGYCGTWVCSNSVASLLIDAFLSQFLTWSYIYHGFMELEHTEYIQHLKGTFSDPFNHLLPPLFFLCMTGLFKVLPHDWLGASGVFIRALLLNSARCTVAVIFFSSDLTFALNWKILKIA